MTSEIRAMIELNDVTGLEVSCPNCPAKIIYPLHSSTTRTVVYACPTCKAPWFVTDRKTDGPDVLQRFLNAFDALAKEKDVLGKIRLSVPQKL